MEFNRVMEITVNSACRKSNSSILNYCTKIICGCTNCYMFYNYLSPWKYAEIFTSSMIYDIKNFKGSDKILLTGKYANTCINMTITTCKAF